VLRVLQQEADDDQDRHRVVTAAEADTRAAEEYTSKLDAIFLQAGITNTGPTGGAKDVPNVA
jgi:hypothetical protein